MLAQLLVRNLDDDVKRLLQRRAARHGRSVEAEVRDILQEAVGRRGKPMAGLGARIASRFRDIGFMDGEIEEIRGGSARDPFAE